MMAASQQLREWRHDTERLLITIDRELRKRGATLDELTDDWRKIWVIKNRDPIALALRRVSIAIGELHSTIEDMK